MVPDQLLDKLHEKHGERKSQWAKFFAKWDKPVANPQKEAIPYEYLTGDNEYFDKRKLTPVSSTRPIKKSKYGKIIKCKKVKKKTCPNVAINGINPVGERSVQQFQGNKEKDEISPILKKIRLDTHHVRKCRTDIGDKDLDIPVKRNKDNRKGCKDTVLPSVLEESVCNGLKRPKCRLKIDEAGNNSQSKCSYLEISPDNGNAYEEKVLLPVPRESLCNELDRRDSILKTDVAADKSRSKLSYPTKSRDNGNAYEEKVLLPVPRESLCNELDRRDSILKTDVAADKSRSKLSYPTKSRDYKNGCEHKELPTVSGECVYNRMDGQSSSYETAEVTNNFHTQHSKSSKSKDYKYHQRRSSTSYHQISFSPPKTKPWGYVIVESDEEDSLKFAY